MKTLRKIATAIAPIVVLGVAGVVIWAVSGRNAAGNAELLSPEATVEEFNRLMLSGQWDAAENLCVEPMSRYIGRFRDAWEEMEDRDSSVFSAAQMLLDSVEVNISRTERAGSGKVLVHYAISSSVPGYEGKRKVAELAEHRTQDEGKKVWRIESIREEIQED